LHEMGVVLTSLSPLLNEIEQNGRDRGWTPVWWKKIVSCKTAIAIAAAIAATGAQDRVGFVHRLSSVMHHSIV
jgi:hypothetical protein